MKQILMCLFFLSYFAYSNELKNEKIIKWYPNALQDFIFRDFYRDSIDNNLYIIGQYNEVDKPQGIFVSKFDFENNSIRIDTLTKKSIIPISTKFNKNSIDLYWAYSNEYKINYYNIDSNLNLIDSVINTNINSFVLFPNNIQTNEKIIYNYSTKRGIGKYYLEKTTINLLNQNCDKQLIDSIEFIGYYNLSVTKVFQKDNIDYILCTESDSINKKPFLYIISSNNIIAKKSYNEISNGVANYLFNNIKIIDNSIYITGYSRIDIPRYFSLCVLKCDLNGKKIIFKDSLSKDSYINDFIIDDNKLIAVGMSRDTPYDELAYNLFLQFNPNLDIEIKKTWSSEDGNNRIYSVEKSNGIYKLIGSVNDKFYFADMINISSFNESNYNNISISPNPASDYIEISLDSHSIKRGQGGVFFEIYNIFGELQELPRPLGTPSKEGEVRLDVSNLVPGVYFIKIGDKFEKFVKL